MLQVLPFCSIYDGFCSKIAILVTKCAFGKYSFLFEIDQFSAKMTHNKNFKKSTEIRSRPEILEFFKIEFVFSCQILNLE